MNSFFIVAETQTQSISAWAAVFAAIITGIVAVGGYILTTKNNTKLSFINTATSSRIKWIAEVRELLSDFITFLPQYNPFILEKIKKNDFDFTNEYFNLNKLIKTKTKLELLLGSKDKGNNNKNYKDFKVINSINEVFNIVNQLNIFFTMYTCISESENFNLAAELDESFCQNFLKNLDFRFFIGTNFKSSKDKLAYFLTLTNGNDEKFLKHICITDINLSIKNIIKKDLDAKINDIVSNSQDLLKYEWERVKAESKFGDLKEHVKLMEFLLKIKQF